MKETFTKQSGYLIDLREVPVSICGNMYSGEFLSSLENNDNIRETAVAYRNNIVYSRFIQEYIKVEQKENGSIAWKAVNGIPHNEYEFDFNSSFGLFHSDDRGEFGGTLITPKSTIRGNFRKIFEQNGKIYAIDTLNHMGIGHTKIYEFNSDLEYKILFETSYDDMLSLSALTITEDKTYILLSGAVLGGNHTFTGSKLQSILFEINENGLTELAEFDHEFHYVYNMIIHNSEMILGMDKLVAVIDITSKMIKAYSPITSEAENDLLKTDI